MEKSDPENSENLGGNLEERDLKALRGPGGVQSTGVEPSIWKELQEMLSKVVGELMQRMAPQLSQSKQA